MNTAKLFGRLVEESITKAGDQLMRALVAFVHQRFDGCGRVLLVEQKPVDFWDRDVHVHVPEDFKSR